MSRLCAAGIGVALVAGALDAQTPNTGAPRLDWQGEVGSYAEAYGISGREARRPSETGRLYLNSTAKLYGKLSVGLNLMLTTENGASAAFGGLPGRQRLNQFGVSPQWSWGRAHAGSFSEFYTPNTLSGIRITGAGFDVRPGRLHVGAFGGQSRQAVFGGLTSGSFERRIVGGRLGLGRPMAGGGRRASFIDVMMVRSWDDPGSLPAPTDSAYGPFLPDSLAAQPDTALLPTDSINPFAVTPQENVVVGVAGGLSLFGGRAYWQGEIDGSIHTRDRRASPLGESTLDERYSGFLQRLVTPRVGTHADHAYRTELELRFDNLPGATPRSPRNLAASIAYRYVGPGYVSLGTAFLPNDQTGIEARTALRIGRTLLHVDGMRQQDNLIDQKLETTVRNRVGVMLNTQPAPRWSSTLRATRVGMTNDAADSLRLVDYSAWVLGTSQTFLVGNRSRVRSVTGSVTMQRVGDENPARANSRLRSYGGDVRMVLGLAPRFTLTPTAGVVRSTVGSEPTESRATYGLAADWRSAGGRWRNTLSIMQSQITRTDALTGRLVSRLRVTQADALVLTIRGNRYRSLVDPDGSFDESTVSLSWARQL
jgi:hypothetical protein